jgi:hypothetical protein
MHERIQPAFDVLRKIHDYAVQAAQEEGLSLQDVNWLLIMEGVTHVALSGADKAEFLSTLHRLVETAWRNAEQTTTH